MKQVHLTINVSDGKFNKLMEFLKKNFGDASIDQADDIDVPKWHKDIVIKRISTSNKEDFFPLKDLDKKVSV